MDKDVNYIQLSQQGSDELTEVKYALEDIARSFYSLGLKPTSDVMIQLAAKIRSAQMSYKAAIDMVFKENLDRARESSNNILRTALIASELASQNS